MIILADRLSAWEAADYRQSMDYLIGVDIGTSYTKAIAYDLKGQILAVSAESYGLIQPEPGHCEQDPHQLLEAVCAAVARTVDAMARNQANARPLGMGFSSAMHGLIAVDQDGKPLTNCMIWADIRSESFANDLKGTPEGHDIYHHTGTPLHPMSPLCKLGWMKIHRRDTFNASARFISVKEYVFFRLFGVYVVDYSIASATGLFDTRRQTWYGPALSAAGITAAQLSEPVSVTYTLRGMDTRLAGRMHLAPDTPVVIGGSDGCLSNVGVQAVKPGIASVTIGTSGAIRVSSPVMVTDPQERLFSYMVTPDWYVTGGAINNGGLLLNWFNDHFGNSTTPQELSEEIASSIQLAATVEPGADGLIFLPYLTGERAPYWDAHAKGVYFGIRLHHGKAHFVRAIMEGVMYSLYSVGKALEETTCRRPELLIANGGFARSTAWVQMLADVFNMEVRLHDSVESAARGAMLLAMQALGYTAEYQSVAEEAVTGDAYLPDGEKHRIYMDTYAKFTRLYDKLKDEF